MGATTAAGAELGEAQDRRRSAPGLVQTTTGILTLTL